MDGDVHVSQKPAFPAGLYETSALSMKHGILPDYTCRFPGDIFSVICSETIRPLVHLHNECRLYCKTAIVGTYPLNSAFDKLISTTHRVHVGICKHSLKLLDERFQCIYEVECPTEVLSATYNETSGELITSGQGSIMFWRFRQRAKVIIPHRTLSEGLCQSDDVTCLHLEMSVSENQRLFAAVRQGVRMYSLESGGRLLKVQDSMHLQSITAILLFRPMNLLITGSKDGTVKVWDSSWQLQCTFVNHRGPITAIVPYPYGPMMVTASLDHTMRIWNVHIQDSMDMLEHELPVEGLFCKRGTSSILSYTKNQLLVWRIQQLYHEVARIGRNIFSLTAVKHPMLPPQVIASCSDSALRMVSPAGGQIITTALLPMDTHIASFTFASSIGSYITKFEWLIHCPSSQETLYALDTTGVVHIYDTKTNPCTLKAVHLPSVESRHVTCLCMYEVIPSEEDMQEAFAADKWLKITLEALQHNHYRGNNERPEKCTAFLLAGTSNGHLAVLDLFTAAVIFSVMGNKSSVTSVACNPKTQQVVSACGDNLIQVWRLYPHMQELLSLQCSFCITSTPSFMIALPSRLIFACNNTELAMYTIDMYCLKEKSCFTGHPANSHTDTICGLDYFTKLNLVASCAYDQTIRVWTEDNLLIRILQLDSVPHGIAFCTTQGDLMVELRSSLHIINNMTYFNDNILKQYLSFRISEPVQKNTGKMYTIDLSSLKPEDCHRLQIEGSPFLLDECGSLSREELEKADRAAREKAAALLLINAQNEELKGICNGSVTSKKKHYGTGRSPEREKAWKQFLHIIHPELGKPQVVIPEVDDFKPDICNTIPQMAIPSPPYQQGPERQFFSSVEALGPPYPIAPDGYMPNSVLLQKLWKADSNPKLVQQWRPIQLTTKQLKEMEENLQEEAEEHMQSSGLRDRLQAALVADTPKSRTPSPPLTPPPEQTPKRVIVPHKKIEKLVAPSKAISNPMLPEAPSPTPSPECIPPPPTPPLPKFIAQFIGKPWFDKLYPNCSSKTFSPTFSITDFVNSLLSSLNKPIDYSLKAEIYTAIAKIVVEENPPIREVVSQSIQTQLLGPPPIQYEGLGKRQFVTQALKLAFALDLFDASMVTVLLFYYAQGDCVLQQLIINYLLRKGLNDPFVYFPKVMEINFTDVSQQNLELFTCCKHWLDNGMTEYRQSLDQAMQPETSLPLNARQYMSNKASTSKLTSRQPKVVAAIGTTSTQQCNPIDAINFVLAREYKKDQERQKPVTPPPPSQEEPEEVVRNTIIALPKIHHPHSLVRVGETHKSCCHPERETTYSLICQLPHMILHQGARRQTPLHAISLALKHQNINPFITEEEVLEEKQISVVSTVRYFVPESSYVRHINS